MKKLLTEEFIRRAKIIHEDKYDYSNVICMSSKDKVEIYCKKHNYYFLQQAGSHLAGCGCPICGNEKKRQVRTTLDDFIVKSREVHGNKYDYYKVVYKGTTNKVCITCNTCETDFWQLPSKHLSGRGCPTCKLANLSSRFRKPLDEFIDQANKVHHSRYDYSKVEFRNLHDKITIICPIHGEFIQEAQSHLQGCRCPSCMSSHLEDDIRSLLIENNIFFEEQKTWDWLVYKSHQYVDFFLPKYNIGIECQGIQHFEPVDLFGGERNLGEVTLRDKNKLDLCNKNGINILYYSNLGEEYNYPYEVITSHDNLINKINLTS